MKRALLGALLALAAFNAPAETIKIAWDASPDAAGYYVKWNNFGPGAGIYHTTVDVGAATTWQAGGFYIINHFCFVIVGYDATQTNESTPSNEVCVCVSDTGTCP